MKYGSCKDLQGIKNFGKFAVHKSLNNDGELEVL